MRQLKSLIVLVALVLGALLWSNHGNFGAGPTTSAPPTAVQPAAQALPAFLPPEARTTLNLIAAGGPFVHRQDGVVFGNYEGRLPSQPRGYYHEYTVTTPGAGNRGARRIITGGTPPAVYYYTSDHYESFQAFDARLSR